MAAAFTPFVRSPASEQMVCGPAIRPGSPATAPCVPRPRHSSVARRQAILRKNCERRMSYVNSFQQNRIARELISGLFLYTSIDPATRRRQCLLRRSSQFIPTVLDASRLEVSPDEMKAAIILFYSLLDEQQRRLFAGMESM